MNDQMTDIGAMLANAEWSDDFFNSPQIENIIGPIEQEDIERAAIEFKKANKYHPWSVEQLVNDFLKRL